MNTRRFTPWIVLACMGTLAACTSGGGTAENTELNVIVPADPSGTGTPSEIDIVTVEYTVDCQGNSDVFLDNAASFPDEVRLDGNLEVVDGRPAPPGSTLANSEIWQGFMDLPPGPCTVQLRARDGDGEVICTATEPFNIAADTTTKVDIVLICDISFQAPVGMLDVDGTFSFNVGNFCPDLFVLNCHDASPAEQDIGIGVLVAVTGCEVRFRDGDSTCGQNCDPQDCSPAPEGLVCIPGPDPGVSTTITCENGTIDCDGNPATPDTSCTILGDNLGTLPEGLDGAIPCTSDADCLAATGSADVVCNAGFCDFSAANPLLNADFFAACTPPALGGIPGVVMTCTAVTTDGDLDCDKTKVVDITCPGLDPCNPAAVPPPPDCTVTGGECVNEVCDSTSGTAVCVFGSNVPSGGGANCTTCPGAPASLCSCDGAGACIDFGCVDDSDCDIDGNECTVAPVGACQGDGSCLPEVNEVDGTACAGGTGNCQAGVCQDNCVGVDCSDANDCTQDVCDNSTNPGTCSNPFEPSGTLCDAGGGNTGACDGAGSCVFVVPFTWLEATVAIDMCCNNNALPQQSIIPIDLTTCVGTCTGAAGGPFTNTMTGLLTFPESFLDVAQTVVVGGVQQADLIDAQVTVQPRGGASGADVAIPAIFPAGTCLIGGTACDVANNVGGGGGNTDCVPVGGFNPCQRLVTVPTTTDLPTCLSLDPPGCTPGTDCTKSDQHALNGFCVTGPLPIPLDTAVGNYTAGAAGTTGLFGWADVGVPGSTVVGGVVTMGTPVFTNPTGPNGLKVNASGLAVAIECIQAVETGDLLTDPVTCGSTADALLNGSGVGGTDVYLVP